MWWKIKYMMWDPYKDEGDSIGGFNEKEENCEEWNKTLERFVELVKNDNIGQVIVITYWGKNVYDPENPYVLTYDAK